MRPPKLDEIKYKYKILIKRKLNLISAAFIFLISSASLGSLETKKSDENALAQKRKGQVYMINETQKRFFLKCYEEGMTSTAISKLIGKTATSIRKFYSRYGN